MIELKNVSKEYNNVMILNNINLKLECGNIYILKGISGSGKTTLLNIISLLDKNFTGKLLLNGSKINYQDYQSNIGYMMQKSLLFKNSTVLENLQLIENNIPKIKEYAKLFNFEHLLDKYPKELSGGERQRVALVRALLNNRKIIIADEPTSSLDYNNSLIFVDYLKKIDIKDKIIIIATHKNIYDDIASAIINIEFGNLKIVKKKKSNFNSFLVLQSKDNKIFNKFVFKNPKSFGKVFNVIIFFFMLAILLVSAIKINYQNEYIKKYLKENACNVFESKEFLSEEIPDIIEQKYYDYELEEDDFTVYSLLNEEESIFKNNKYILYGHFPSKNEVLVNINFVYLKYPDVALKKIIGKNVVINNQEYIISGIIDNLNVSKVYTGFYEELLDEPRPAVFLNYDILKNIGTINSETVLLKIKDKELINIYLNKKYERNFIENYQFIEAQYNIKYLTNDTEHTSNIALIIIIIIAVVLLIFLANQITLELYFKRKEIGYLQVFNFSKKQVRKIYLLQYLFNILKIFALAFLTYLVVVMIIYLKFKLNYFLHSYLIIGLLILILSYVFLIIIFPLNKLLKKDIIELIR